MVDHQRRVDRGEVGLVDPHEAGKRTPLTDLVAAYVARPDAAGQNPRRLVGERERLLLAFAEMGVTTFLDIVGSTGHEATPKVEGLINKLRLGEVRPGAADAAGRQAETPPAGEPADPARLRSHAEGVRPLPGRARDVAPEPVRDPAAADDPEERFASARTAPCTPAEIDLLVQAAELRPVQQRPPRIRTRAPSTSMPCGGTASSAAGAT
jgi:hypothetical protein